uniref:YhcH/YjgK/YiaL family protein n=1 Tax=Thaumasiovibrio occultus TaxID=1891184 RepID=UPI000B35D0C5|nr:YhcH/YjgK/YiaL family protein [Thaumasiovibrio occultus]
MFTGHRDHLPDARYLSATLLGHIQTAFAAIKANPQIGDVTLIDELLSYSIIDANCTSPVGKPAEIHQHNIDVHLVLAGQDQIGYSNLPLTITDDSRADIDLYFGPLENEDCVTLTAGQFAIFFPQEVHKPLCDFNDTDHPVTKAIIKIRFDKL